MRTDKTIHALNRTIFVMLADNPGEAPPHRRPQGLALLSTASTMLGQVNHVHGLGDSRSMSTCDPDVVPLGLPVIDRAALDRLAADTRPLTPEQSMRRAHAAGALVDPNE